jgi:hypothetical protein
MKPSLPRFILGAVVCLAISPLATAQTPLSLGGSSAAQPPAAEIDRQAPAPLLPRVLVALDAQLSVSAKVRHKVDLLGHPMFGEGTYWQQGRGGGRRLKFELTLQGDTPLSTLQLCDGQNLWVYEAFGSRKNLSRIDVERLRRAKPKPPAAAPRGNAWQALGGMTKLVGELASSYEWGKSTDSLLDQDLRVWTVEGRWSAEKLVEMLPDQKDAIRAGRAVDLTKLAPNLPDRVVLHIGCDDLFPYRFEYWRAEPQAKNEQPLDRGRLISVMEFYEVQLGGPIDPQQFVFTPNDLQPVDRTQSFLDQFGLEEIAGPRAMKGRPARR